MEKSVESVYNKVNKYQFSTDMDKFIIPIDKEWNACYDAFNENKTKGGSKYVDEHLCDEQCKWIFQRKTCSLGDRAVGVLSCYVLVRRRLRLGPFFCAHF